MKQTETCEQFQKVNQNIHGNIKGCEECEKIDSDWDHLRLCLLCDHVGCCDSFQYKHETKHFHDTRHSIIESYEQVSLGNGAM